MNFKPEYPWRLALCISRYTEIREHGLGVRDRKGFLAPDVQASIRRQHAGFIVGLWTHQVHFSIGFTCWSPTCKTPLYSHTEGFFHFFKLSLKYALGLSQSHWKTANNLTLLFTPNTHMHTCLCKFPSSLLASCP